MLDSLYRARRGESNEQQENFLSAALGLVLRCSPVSRACLAPLFGIPAAGPIRVADQETLYCANESVGRIDLRLDTRNGSRPHPVGIEVKFDAKADPKQLEGYKRALDQDGGKLVLLSRRETDTEIAREVGCGHVTWQQVVDVLAPVADPIAVELVAFLEEREVWPSPSITFSELRAGLSPAHIDFNNAIKSLLPELVPFAYRERVRSLLDEGYSGYTAGYYMDTDEETAKDKGLSIACLGIEASRAALDGLKLTLWTYPLGAELQGELVERAAWEEASGYLFAQIGTFWPDEPLSGCLFDAISRSRALLKVSKGFSTGHGLWRQSTEPANPPGIHFTVGELRAALDRAARVSVAANRLSDLWLRTVRNEFGEERCNRITRFHNGSFYTKGNTLQFGARFYPGNADDQGAYAWAWFKDTAHRARFEKIAQKSAWTTSEGTNPKTVILKPPLTPKDVLDPASVHDLGTAIAGFLSRATA